MALHSHLDSTDLHRNAYNAAFYELGLGWHWDSQTFDSLHPVDCKTERIRRYLTSHQSHLLNAYEPDFLANAIEQIKSRCLTVMADIATNDTAPRTSRTVTDWAALQSRQIGA